MGARLVLHSEMAEGGAIFADGIESDALEFLGGQTMTVRRAEQAVPSGEARSATNGRHGFRDTKPSE